jgi:hypothetical protein
MSSHFDHFLAWERVSRDTIDFKKVYVDIAGDLVTGLMLSQIIYWHLPDHTGASKLRVEREGYLWLVKRRTDWWEECRISPKQADRALAQLEQLRLVETTLAKFDGAPMKHIRLVPDVFLAAWEQALGGKSIFPKGQNPISPKGENLLSPRGEMDFPDRGRSLTKTTAETTTQNLPIEEIEEDASIIRRFFVEVCRSLGDMASEQSIGQRAVNLWDQSGLSRAEFMKIAYHARDRTRLYQGKQRPGTEIRSKAAYFFEIVANEINGDMDR